MLDKEWIVVSIDETLPSIIDINMAIERILTSTFIRENLNVLSKHNTTSQISAIPEMFSMEYIIGNRRVIRRSDRTFRNKNQ